MLPLLRSIATGELCAGDEQVRQTARKMESSLRDELLLNPGEHGLGEHLARLRGQGWQVHSTLTSEEPPGVLGAAARIVALLGPATGPGQVLTISSNGTNATAVMVGTDEEQASLWRTKLDEVGGIMGSDHDFLRMTVEAR
ncbi:hypothetical protein GCM10027030_26660 [Luteococcus sediminum]